MRAPPPPSPSPPPPPAGLARACVVGVALLGALSAMLLLLSTALVLPDWSAPASAAPASATAQLAARTLAALLEGEAEVVAHYYFDSNSYAAAAATAATAGGEPVTAADGASHAAISRLLAAPALPVVSEEGVEAGPAAVPHLAAWLAAAATPARSSNASRGREAAAATFVLVDPLDATAEFAEAVSRARAGKASAATASAAGSSSSSSSPSSPSSLLSLTRYVSLQACVVRRGLPVAGVLRFPFSGRTYVATLERTAGRGRGRSGGGGGGGGGGRGSGSGRNSSAATTGWTSRLWVATFAPAGGSEDSSEDSRSRLRDERRALGALLGGALTSASFSGAASRTHTTHHSHSHSASRPTLTLRHARHPLQPPPPPPPLGGGGGNATAPHAALPSASRRARYFSHAPFDCGAFDARWPLRLLVSRSHFRDGGGGGGQSSPAARGSRRAPRAASLPDAVAALGARCGFAGDSDVQVPAAAASAANSRAIARQHFAGDARRQGLAAHALRVTRAGGAGYKLAAVVDGALALRGVAVAPLLPPRAGGVRGGAVGTRHRGGSRGGSGGGGAAAADAYVHDGAVRTWDLCAGSVLVAAAGGAVSAWDGAPHDFDLPPAWLHQPLAPESPEAAAAAAGAGAARGSGGGGAGRRRNKGLFAASGVVAAVDASLHRKLVRSIAGGGEEDEE